MARSQAERYRRHREVFQLAQELGCTPKEAEAESARRAAAARWQETSRRLAAKMGTPAPSISAPSERPQQWWQRDDL